MLLAYEPVGEMAAPSPVGVRLLGIEATQTRRWPAMRHVFDLGDEAGLHVLIGPTGGMIAYAVGYDSMGDEMLTAL